MEKQFKPLTALLIASALTLPFLEAARAEVSQESLNSISIPNKVETPIGSLDFFDGVPSKATAEKVYDNLDRMRATGVFLDNVGAVSMYSVRTGLADAGSKDETEQIADIAGCRFLALPGPLGTRLSAAAADVRGEWLLFLRPGAELDPGWVGETTHFIERAPAEMAAVFTPEQGPKGHGSLWSDLLGVFRARQSVLKPGRGLLISKSLYRQLGGQCADRR